MATIKSSIELQDNFSSVMMDIVDSVDQGTSAVDEFARTVSAPMDTTAFAAVSDAVSDIAADVERFGDSLRNALNQQEQFNQKMLEGANASGKMQNGLNGMTKKLLSIASITAAITGAFKFIPSSLEAYDIQSNAEIQLISVLANNPDENLISQFEAELAVDTSQAIEDINDIQNDVDEVTITVSARTQAIEAAYDQIVEKAQDIQSRGIYGDEVMIAAAAEFSTYFSDTDAVTLMMDTLTNYAMGMSGGGAIDTSGMVDYATNLGKIMTGAYDAMTKKGFEFSDAQKAIIEGTATQSQIVSTLGEEYLAMSSDMQAAAAISQVIEESWSGLYENMSATPRGKLIQLNNAWGDLTETIGERLYPYVVQFVDIIEENWPTIEEIADGITMALQAMLNVLAWVLEKAIGVARYIIDNWSQIEPVITPIVAALVAYKVAMGVATVAQWLYNAAMYACPITWIILGIALLIGMIYWLVGAINEVQGTSISATAIICGSVMAAIATIWNIIAAAWNFIVDIIDSLWNLIAVFANFFGNVFTDPIGSICRLFFGLYDFVLSILEAIASAIDAIFGSDFSSFWTTERDNLSQWLDDTFGPENEIMPYAHSEDLKLEVLDAGEWFDMGAEFGEGVDATISGFFDDLEALGNGTDDLLRQIGEQNGLLEGIGNDTGNISDALEISAEDLKYLRDIAEQETVNRFTTAEIHIEQTNHNNISSKMDLDGVIDGLTDAVDEAVVIIAEGVHA